MREGGFICVRIVVVGVIDIDLCDDSRDYLLRLSRIWNISGRVGAKVDGWGSLGRVPKTMRKIRFID